MTRLLIVVAILIVAGARSGAVFATQEASTPTPTSADADDATSNASSATEVPATEEAATATPTDVPAEPTAIPTLEPTATPTLEATSLPTSEPSETVVVDETPEAIGSGEEAVPPSPTVSTTPVVILTTGVSCSGLGTYTGVLTIEIETANATVTDIHAFDAQDRTLFSVMLDVPLPAVLQPGTVSWSWQPETTIADAPDALLVRIAELPGTDDANAAADDARGGWLLATVEGSTDCTIPTPTSTATATTPDATPSPAQGVPSTPTEEASWTPTPSAAGSSVATPDAIVVTAMDSRVAAIPGQTVDQHFQVSNTSDVAMTVQLTATSSSPSWTVELLAEDGESSIDQPIVISAHGVHEVIVRFSVPPDAYAGDRSTIALDVESDASE